MTVYVPTPHLLDEDDNISFNPSLARAIGSDRAVVLRKFHLWIRYNQKAESKRKEQPHFQEGHWWTYGSYEAWLEREFVWLSYRTLRRIIQWLEEMYLLVSETKFNKYPDDNTKWYAINYEKYEVFIKLWYEYGCPRYDAKSDDYKAFIQAWKRLNGGNGGDSGNDSPNDDSPSDPPEITENKDPENGEAPVQVGRTVFGERLSKLDASHYTTINNTSSDALARPPIRPSDVKKKDERPPLENKGINGFARNNVSTVFRRTGASGDYSGRCDVNDPDNADVAHLVTWIETNIFRYLHLQQGQSFVTNAMANALMEDKALTVLLGGESVTYLLSAVTLHEEQWGAWQRFLIRIQEKYQRSQKGTRSQVIKEIANYQNDNKFRDEIAYDEETGQND